jgi:VWFA-related protein
MNTRPIPLSAALCASPALRNRSADNVFLTEKEGEISKKLLVLMSCALVVALSENPPEVRIRTGAWFPPSLKISADANLVELAATVRDREGHLTAGLKSTDFEVLDNGQPRGITFFSELRSAGEASAATDKKAGVHSPEAPAPSEPRTIALFFDDVHASVLLHKSGEAAEKLISNDLRAGDRVGIFTASGTTSVDFTGDRDLLRAGLARLKPHPLDGVHPIGTPPMTPFQAYVILHRLDPDAETSAMAAAAPVSCTPMPACVGSERGAVASTAQMVWDLSQYQYTTTLDAMSIVMRHLAAASGKRIMILMSPGFPTGGMENRTSSLIDDALRANIRISAVSSTGLETVSPKLALLRKTVNGEFMTAAAKSTGGRYLSDTNDWAGSLHEVTADPEVSYVLGFSPPDPDGQYHALKMRIRVNRGYSVETRTGYFAAKTRGETAQQLIDRFAMSSDDVKEFPATLQVQQATVKEGGTILQVTITADAKGLKFPEKEGHRVEELTFLTVVEDADGNFVAGRQSVMDLALTPATLAEKLRKGIQATTSIPAPHASSYRVREVVREAVQNHCWASTTAVEIR